MIKVLLSIKPVYYQAIIQKKKTVEFRRKFPLIQKDFKIVFYVSSPVKAICAEAICAPVEKKEIPSLLKELAYDQISDKRSLEDYFKDLKEGFLIRIKSVKEYKTKQTIDFHPPQNYRYLR